MRLYDFWQIWVDVWSQVGTKNRPKRDPKKHRTKTCEKKGSTMTKKSQLEASLACPKVRDAQRASATQSQRIQNTFPSVPSRQTTSKELSWQLTGDWMLWHAVGQRPGELRFNGSRVYDLNIGKKGNVDFEIKTAGCQTGIQRKSGMGRGVYGRGKQSRRLCQWPRRLTDDQEGAWDQPWRMVNARRKQWPARSERMRATSSNDGPMGRDGENGPRGANATRGETLTQDGETEIHCTYVSA